MPAAAGRGLVEQPCDCGWRLGVPGRGPAALRGEGRRRMWAESTRRVWGVGEAVGDLTHNQAVAAALPLPFIWAESTRRVWGVGGGTVYD